MKNQLISVGLLSLVLAGCNMTDFRLPTVGEDNSNNTATAKSASSSNADVVSNPLIEEICATAVKNKVRANDLYRGKVVSGVGTFELISNDPAVKINTKDFHVTMDMNKKTEPWRQYDEGQKNVSSGNVKIKNVSFNYPIGGEYGTGKYLCFIHAE